MASSTSDTCVIEPSDIATAVRVAAAIPEFQEPPLPAEYRRRLSDVPHLILVARSGSRPVGFKIGYERDGSFYSWLGGVVPAHRRRGIARRLAEAQEEWARAQGYDHINFKTRNQHRAMLIFALNNGFQIVGFRQKETVATNRILLRKPL